MKFGNVAMTIAVTTLLAAPAVFAHPGHVHGAGPVHGFAWFDVALFLLVAAAVPALVWERVRRRNRPR